MIENNGWKLVIVWVLFFVSCLAMLQIDGSLPPDNFVQALKGALGLIGTIGFGLFGLAALLMTIKYLSDGYLP